MPALHGVFPVLPTPFDPSGQPDAQALARLVDFAIEAGVHGVVYPGMASEVETLSVEERAALVAAVGKRLAGRKPFVVGASAAAPQDCAARIFEGRQAGAVAAMVMAPAALGSDVAAHRKFYGEIAAAAPGMALMLQNAPPPNGAGLSPELVAQVSEAVPEIRYVKEETLPCGQHVGKILAATGGRLDGVLGGAGARFIMDELSRGACGTMPALDMPELHARLWRAWHDGDRAGARTLYTASLPLLSQQMVFRWRITKEVLRRRGLIASAHTRAKGPALDAGDLAELDALLLALAPLLDVQPPR
jgi:4-hydroxy-tetrahydrodipicolinate synthase